MRDDEYFAIKDRAAAVLLRIPHVTGVGMGGREKDGRPTGEIVIKVFVERKRHPAEVPPGEMIPSSFEGVPTDVVEMSVPTPFIEPGAVAPQAMTMDDTLTDPLRGGITLVFERPVGGGTMGCILRDLNDATAIYGLTNHHVASIDGRLSPSRTILHPSGTGSFRRLGYAAVGADEPTRDAAVVRLEPGFKWLPAIKEIGFVRGTAEVTIAEVATQQYQVRKRGAKTKLTGGVVIAIGVVTAFFPGRSNFDMVIRGNHVSPPHFPNQQVYFAFRGDSGSAVVNEDNKVVALLWGGDFESSVQFPTAVATPIRIVLERFRKVDNLDLVVAVALEPNPTEVNELQVVPFPAGAPRLSASELFSKSDHGHHRPLRGGTQIVAEPFGFANATTLGCVVTTVGNPGKAFILTSYPGLTSNDLITPTTDTDVGQPDNSDSCSLCCKNTVGEFAKRGPGAASIAALVELEDDQKWLAEIMQAGPILDVPAPPLGASDIGKLQVKKRGAATRLTGGVVTAVGGIGGVLPEGVRSDAMIIRPNPNPFLPDKDIFFSHRLDRGALVVNDFNQPLGLLYDEKDISEGGVTIGLGVAMPIRLVLDAFNGLPDIKIEIASATISDDVRTTTRVITDHETSTPPIVATRRPRREAVPGVPIGTPLPAGAFAWLQAELSRSIAGRLAMSIWSDHRGEIRHLIDHNRKVATAWRRSGGPALLQALSRAVHLPSVLLPRTVNGRPIAECIDRLARVLCRYGSPSLRSDVAQLHSVLPPIGGGSLAELLMTLNRA